MGVSEISTVKTVGIVMLYREKLTLMSTLDNKFSQRLS